MQSVDVQAQTVENLQAEILDQENQITVRHAHNNTRSSCLCFTIVLVVHIRPGPGPRKLR